MTSGPDKERLPICDGKTRYAGPCMKQCEGVCPLGMDHPPTGDEFCLGCGLCRNKRDF